MAGYVFALGGDKNPIEIIKECVEQGVYSTRISSVAAIPFEGTMTDYLTMKPGDNIYFFCKRKYYGIGELVSVGPDCKYCNYPESSKLELYNYSEVKDDLLVDFGEESPSYRWVCTFKGAPYMFERGIDTDEILTYKPNSFKMLRAFWKVSFIKLSEEENQALKEIMLLRHQQELKENAGYFKEYYSAHEAIKSHTYLEDYVIKPDAMLRCCENGNKLKHEMALEAAVAYDVLNSNIECLGSWDYVSHQVVASPFKPVDYMDRIDVFGMRYLPNTTIPCKYLVSELKRDIADSETINQVLKYVDWVCDEYAYGDYSAIEACIIAADYPIDIEYYYQDVVQRYYTLGSHPVRNKQWNNLLLIKYEYHDGQIQYYDVTPIKEGY